MAEQVESVDRISSLPDAILRHILSFLPTKYVVSTCILSTRWSHLFPVSNNLDFDESLVFNPQTDGGGTCRFMDFVERCIMLMNGTHIHRFRLKCIHDVDTSRVNSWICTAPLRNVQELDLSIPSGQHKLVSVFKIATLVVLKLHACVLDVPASVDLPSLKTLHLDSMQIRRDDRSVQRLLSNSHVLEELLMVQCVMDIMSLSSPSLKRLTIDNEGAERHYYKFALDAPSLLYLKYTFSPGGGYTLKNLHSLSEAHITIEDPWWWEGQVALPEFFEGIGSVQSLYLYGNFLGEDFLKGWDELPLCKNVTRLEFSQGTRLKLCVLMKFLKCCPNLEEFVFHESMEGEYNYGCADVPSCTRLKLIECGFYFDAGKATRKNLELLEYLLKNSNVLEKMRIHLWWCYGFGPSSYEEANEKFEMMMGTMKELAEAPGRSKSRKIEVSLLAVVPGSID